MSTLYLSKDDFKNYEKKINFRIDMIIIEG